MRLPKLITGLCFVICASFAAIAEEPKLIVAIVVDQMRYDYLEKFHEQFAASGLRMLMERGAFFTSAHYDYAPTVTGPGHASYLSGASPALHGIIGNDWFDRATKKMLNCVEDSSARGVGISGKYGGRSPRNFIGSNFADELRLRHHSKVVGLSLKDRGAILPAGKKPAGAYWFDSSSGRFATSTYYKTELPNWVEKFNAREIPKSYIGKSWSRLLDEKFYDAPSPAIGAGKGDRDSSDPREFTRVIKISKSEGYETIVPTPFGNELLTDFAIAAIEGERLGSTSRPDLLCISYSSTDACGHIYGPYSQEEQDIILRLDGQLESLFKAIEDKIGLKNTIILLTADHGVAPTPESATADGLDAERVNLMDLMAGLSDKITARFGEGKFLLSPRLVDGNLYFNDEALAEKKISSDELAQFIRDWALATGKFYAAYTRNQLLEKRVFGPIGERIANGFNAQRSGDVVLVLNPFCIAGERSTGTTHGSPFSYDTHVPVLMFGARIKPGRYVEPFAITDIVPTLCAVLGLTEPAACMGKPFVKALVER
jgi:predicted AlkP superfamily pyrophosphatase or phosphodiesterase